MAEPVAQVLTRVAAINGRIGPLVLELLNYPDSDEQADQLRQVGQHLGSLSAELLARAAELDGRVVEPPDRVIIDAWQVRDHPVVAGSPRSRHGWTGAYTPAPIEE